jgi:hypothetical protein
LQINHAYIMTTEEIRFLKAEGAKVDGLLSRVHEIVANNGQPGGDRIQEAPHARRCVRSNQ